MKKFLTITLVFICLILSSCSILEDYKPKVERESYQKGWNARGTALAAEQTGTPISEQHVIDEDCEKYDGMIDCSTPTPQPKEAETSQPQSQSVKIVGSGEYIWYYSDQDLNEDQKLGQLQINSKWEMIGESDNAIQIRIRGMVPKNDLAIYQGFQEIEGEPHPWGHLGEKEDTHTHMWGNELFLRAQIPPGLAFKFTDEETLMEIRDTKTGEIVDAIVVGIILDFETWVPKTNTEYLE